MSEPLQRIIYISGESRRFSPLDLQDLLVTSRKKNSEMNITGLLLYKHGNFMQVIEGPPSQVSALFDSVKNDPRHRRVIEVINEEIRERDFNDWSMAFRNLDNEPLPEIRGYNWLLNESPEAMDLTLYSNTIRSLLSVFARATNAS